MWKIKSINEYIVTTESTKKEKVMQDSIVHFSNGDEGIVITSTVYDKRTIAKIALYKRNNIKRLLVSNKVVFKNEKINMQVSSNFLGKVVDFRGNVIEQINPLKPIKEIAKTETKIIDFNDVKMINRQPVTKPLLSGSMLIDVLIPIGKGQRQLILGDKNSGKTMIGLNFIKSNYNDSNIVFIYNGIGKTLQEINVVKDYLILNNLQSKVIILFTSISDSNISKTYSPYAATTLAEYFKDKNMDVVIIYDDLLKQSDAYRSIALNTGQTPSREAYPGDIFYLHSRLLERSGSFVDQGTITSLPIVETIEEDYTSYIPTNIVSITDGQIATSIKKFNLNIFPSINFGPSVSRIGSSAQVKLLKPFKGSSSYLFSLFENYDERYESHVKDSPDNYAGYILSNFFKHPNNDVYKPWVSFLLLTVVKHKLIKYVFDQKNLDDIKDFIINHEIVQDKIKNIILEYDSKSDMDTLEKIIVTLLKPIISFKIRVIYEDNALILPKIIEHYKGYNFMINLNQQVTLDKTIKMSIKDLKNKKNKSKNKFKNKKNDKKAPDVNDAAEIVEKKVEDATKTKKKISVTSKDKPKVKSNINSKAVSKKSLIKKTKSAKGGK